MVRATSFSLAEKGDDTLIKRALVLGYKESERQALFGNKDEREIREGLHKAGRDILEGRLSPRDWPGFVFSSRPFVDPFFSNKENFAPKIPQNGGQVGELTEEEILEVIKGAERGAFEGPSPHVPYAREEEVSTIGQENYPIYVVKDKLLQSPSYLNIWGDEVDSYIRGKGINYGKKPVQSKFTYCIVIQRQDGGIGYIDLETICQGFQDPLAGGSFFSSIKTVSRTESGAEIFDTCPTAPYRAFSPYAYSKVLIEDQGRVLGFSSSLFTVDWDGKISLKNKGNL